MKKITYFIAFLLFTTMAFAQSLDFTRDGRHYYIASPNGHYFTGTGPEGPGYFFSAANKQHVESDIDSVSLYAVNNDGIACGSYMGKPAVWIRGGEWKMLTALGTINGQPIESGTICGMSADATKFVVLFKYGGGKAIPVFCELDKFENWDNDDAWEFSTLPTPKKDDLIYNQSAQFIQVCGMNYDATRILGRYMLLDGKRQVPFVWQKTDGGVWNIKFVAERCLFIDEVLDGTLTMPDNREDLKTPEEIRNYDETRESLETGILYDLSPYSLFAWTGNGRYIPVCVNLPKEVDDNTLGTHSESGVNYAAVIDVDQDTLIIFTKVANAGSLSVNDRGEVMIYSPKESTFRTSYVASIETPTEAVSLLEYTKQRSNGKIDLEPYMTYQRDEDFDGNPVYEVATGSAIWANEGDAFVTFNYDEWNENFIPHCYMVRFTDIVPVENVTVNQLSVYPNPTSGVVYFEKEIENVVVFDIAGRQVYSQSVAEKSINLSALNVGTYILTAQSEGENIITKVMISR